MKKVLLIDGFNLIYRSRGRFNVGEFGIVFSFLRSLRSICEKFNSDEVYFVLEGRPHHRYDLLPEYKANRVKEVDESFANQKNIILDILKNYIPINVISHKNYECDDVIANLANKVHCKDECIVVSTDSDFIQLLSKDSNRIKLYNPRKKSFIDSPDYDYVAWKALVGDKSDNIDGFSGIGPKRAESILENNFKMQTFLDDPEKRNLFDRNVNLIKFSTFSNSEISECFHSKTDPKWDELYSRINEMQFHSMLTEKYWQKFTDTF